MASFNPLLTSVELGLFYSKERNLAVIHKIAGAQSLPLGLHIRAFFFFLCPLSYKLISSPLHLVGTSHRHFFITLHPQTAQSYQLL